MNLKIISKNKKGAEGLREMLRDSRGRIKKSFYVVSIINENPFTINFELKKLASSFASNQTIRNTVITGIKEELERSHNLTEREIEVEF